MDDFVLPHESDDDKLARIEQVLDWSVRQPISPSSRPPFGVAEQAAKAIWDLMLLLKASPRTQNALNWIADTAANGSAPGSVFGRDITKVPEAKLFLDSCRDGVLHPEDFRAAGWPEWFFEPVTSESEMASLINEEVLFSVWVSQILEAVRAIRKLLGAPPSSRQSEREAAAGFEPSPHANEATESSNGSSLVAENGPHTHSAPSAILAATAARLNPGKRQVLRLIYTFGPMTGAQLTKAYGVIPGAPKNLATSLVSEGFLKSGGERRKNSKGWSLLPTGMELCEFLFPEETPHESVTEIALNVTEDSVR